MHVRVNIKPLSANELWAGRRFKTAKYNAYRAELALLLPPIDPFPEPPYRLELEFGVSNRQADVDNPIKGVTDALQFQYGFNDNKIYELTARKVIVPRGAEYISFNIKHLE